MIVVLMFVATAGAAPAVRQADGDASMQGQWQPIAMFIDKVKQPPEAFDRRRFVISSGTFVFRETGDIDMVFRMKIDRTKSPHEIDITGDVGPTFPGIYKVDGMTLTIAFGNKKLGRPKGFTPTDGCQMYVLKRAK